MSIGSDLDAALSAKADVSAIPAPFDPTAINQDLDRVDAALVALTKRVAALEGADPGDGDPDPTPTNDYPAWTTALADHWAKVTWGATILAPTSIPHDGIADTAGPLAAWIKAQPGGVLDLSPLASPLWVFTGHGLDLRGIRPFTKVVFPKGQVIHWGRGADDGNLNAFMLLGATHDVEIDGNDANPVGGNTGVGTTAQSYHDHFGALLVRNGASFINVHGFSWDNVGGFGPGTYGDDAGAPATDVWIHDCTVRGAECGIGFTSGVRVWWDHLVLLDSSISAIDLEPDLPAHVQTDLALTNLTVSDYGWNTVTSPWFLQSCPSGTAESNAMDRLFVADVTVDCPGAPALTHKNYPGIGGLAIRADDHNPKSGFVFRRLSTTRTHTRSDAVMRFRNVRDLEVSGIVQPRTAGTLVSDVGGSGTRNVQT